MLNRNRPIAIVASILVSMCISPAGAAPPLDGGRLDDVEGGICRETSGLKRAIAGAEEVRRESARLAQRMGRGDETEQRQAFLRNEIAQRAVGAQDQIVADTRRSLLSYQGEYRRLTGKEFDLSLCNGSTVRVTHAMQAQQQKEQEWQANVAMTSRVLADGEAYRQALIACEDWKIMQQPAETVERWRPGYMQEARGRFSAFSSDYQRKNGKPFDPKSCR